MALWTGFTGFTGWNGNQYPVYPVNPVKIFDFSNDLGKLLPTQCLRDSFYITKDTKYFQVMKKWYLIPAVLLVLILLPCVSGDIGPKPSMKFNLVYETQGVPELIDGQQMECGDAGCLDARPLERLGPQGFDCTQDECNSMAYGYSQYHRLVINFSDQQRQSNIFKSSAYNAEFNVRVTDTGLVVEEVPPFKRITSGDIFIFVILNLKSYLLLPHQSP